MPTTSKKHSAILFSPRATSDERPATGSPGFTLIEVIGVLAVIATLMAIIAPNFIDRIDRLAQEQETENIKTIAQGLDAYLASNLDFPNNLNQLSPDFVPIGDSQISTNERGFTRYFGVHPDLTPFQNRNGVAAADITDLRYLLITDLTQNANPNLNNAAQFDNWWNTDETSTPDVIIYRGTVKPMFFMVSLSAIGDGGSYRIDGNSTNSNPGALSSYSNYHLRGSLVELSEDSSFGSGSGVTISFSLANDVGYQFDPNCRAGAQWHVLGSNCS